MSDVITELLRNSAIPPIARPFVLALCKGEGGTDVNAWARCYGGSLYEGPLNVVFNSANPLWDGKQGPSGISHALGAAQFQPGTYEEVAGRTGLRTIMPQSQLSNTWNHMRVVYMRVTGKDVLDDLMAGAWPAVARALTPTWVSLGLTDLLTKRYNTAVAQLAAIGPTPAPVPPDVPTAPSGDTEFRVMAEIFQALMPLDAVARKRVIDYVVSRLSI